MSERTSIYEFAGGEMAFLALAAAFHERRCLADPVLNHPFSHSSPHHVENLAAYWAEVFGGPARYSRSLGSHSGMLEMHAGTGAEDAFGPHFVECFMHALDDADLPADAEFRTALGEYVHWAVGEVMAISPRGAVVSPDLPVPRWSWSGPA
jgi:hemoglobin